MTKFVAIFPILLFVGCTHFNSEYNCPAYKGIPCRRLSEVDQEYNCTKSMNKNEPFFRQIYAQSDHIDVHIKGYEDESGTYHHPRTISIKTSDNEIRKS